MNENSHAAVRAAMSVAKQIYAQSERPTEDEIRDMVGEALHVFPPSETGADQHTLLLMIGGMLEFGNHVEAVHGFDAFNKLARLAAIDAQARAALRKGSAAFLFAMADELKKADQD